MNYYLHFGIWNGCSVIIYNVISGFVLFPLAIAVLLLTHVFPLLLENVTLRVLGDYSYEIFLLHGFFMGLLEDSVVSLLLYTAVVAVCSMALHWLCKRMTMLRQENNV